MKRDLLERLVAAQESNRPAVLARSLSGDGQFLLDGGANAEAPDGIPAEILRQARDALGRDGARTVTVAGQRYLLQTLSPHGDNDRLRAKAERNLQRINEAFGRLKTYEPPTDAPPENLLTQSYQAIINLGDMVKTGVQRRVQPRRHGPTVLGVDDVRRRRSHRPPRSRRPAVVTGMVLAVVVAGVLWLIIVVT